MADSVGVPVSVPVGVPLCVGVLVGVGVAVGVSVGVVVAVVVDVDLYERKTRCYIGNINSAHKTKYVQQITAKFRI